MGARDHCVSDSSYLSSGREKEGETDGKGLRAASSATLFLFYRGHSPSPDHKWRWARQQPHRTRRKRTEVHASSSKALFQIRAVCWAAWFWNSLLSSSHGWTNVTRVTDRHTIICAPSLKHPGMFCHCTCRFRADKICWAKFCVWLFWGDGGETWVTVVCWGSLFLERRFALELSVNKPKLQKTAAAVTTI